MAPEKEKDVLIRMVSGARRIADALKGYIGDVRVISHHDADGITSAAIICKALAREGKGFHLSFIKQLYEEDIDALSKEEGGLIVFLDLGSGQLDLIQDRLISEGKRVIVADHHQIQGEIVSDSLMHLNPTEFGIEENISGSGTAYLIARAMSPENKELSELAVIGAIGDSQMGSIGPHWGLIGLNKEILKDAENAGKIKVSKGLRIWGRTTRPIHKALEYSVDPYIPGISNSESGAVHFLQEIGVNLRDENGEWKTLSTLTKDEMEKLTTGIIKERVRDNHENPHWIFGDVYDLLDKNGIKDANEFATILNSAGKQNMGHVGVALCLNDKEYFTMIDEMLNKYRREIGKSLRWLEKNMGNVRRTENANYVLAGSKIPENVVSNVVSIAHRSRFLPDSEKDKPLFAFVDSDRGETKISARLSDDAVEKGLSLQEVISKAASVVGGQGGGHAGAAGASIPKGEEERFINSIEEILKKVSENQNEETGTTEGINDGREEGEAGREEAGEKAEGQEGVQEAERKGLVRYFGA